MKRSKIVLFVMVLVLVLAACSPAATETPAAVEPEVMPTEAVVEQPTEAPAEEATEAPAVEEATEEPAAEASGAFNLYTSEPEDKVAEMVADFNTMYPDVTVNVFRSGSGEVIAKIQAEKEAGDIQADVIWFADMDFFKSLADEGLMMEYEPKGTEELDEQYHYNNHQYHETRLIFNVVAYNTSLVTTPPTSWQDLLNEEYSGQVGMASALYSGAAFNQVGTLMNMPDFGWEFYEALNDNSVVVERGNGAVATKLASGEFAIGQLVDFMARDLKASGSPVDHVWPVEGALLVPTPIGILADTPNPGAAQAFIDYMFTDQAQELYVRQGYISVFPDIAPPEGTPDMANFKVLMPDEAFISENRDTIRSQFEELFGVPAE